MNGAILYLDNLQVVEYPDADGEAIKLAIRDIRKAKRPFVKLRKCLISGSIVWRLE